MILIALIIGIVLIHRAAKKALPQMQVELAQRHVNPAVEKINLKREREWLKKELAKEMRKPNNAKTTFRIKARIEKVETVLFK